MFYTDYSGKPPAEIRIRRVPEPNGGFEATVTVVEGQRRYVVTGFGETVSDAVSAALAKIEQVAT